MPRRSARSQNLPSSEEALLRKLKGDALYLRCKELYDAGWPLRAIGEAFYPALSRSTIHTWIVQSPIQPTLPITDLPPIPVPELATDETYVRKTKPSPGIPQHHLDNIQQLAPIARKYRARIPPGAPAYQANQALTLICKALHADGVTIKELADAAGVSYRAMSKRVGKDD